jgi:hypothetical protein
MADPIRLFAEFKDDQGTDWRLNIHDADYAGSAVEFNLGADGFVLRYSGNNEDRYQPIIGSEVTFTLTETETAHETFMNLLAQNVEVRFSVSIRKDPDGTDDLWWCGILLPEQVIRPYDAQPIQNTLTASDDIGNLQSIKYNNDGSAYTGSATIVEHLLNCLNKTRATHLWSTDDFLYYVNDFDSSDYTGSNQLNDCKINHAELYNIQDGQNEYFDAFKVLSDIARVFNARIFQAQGKWWFLPVGAQKYSQTLTVEGTQKDGTAITQQSLTADKDFDSTFHRLNGYEYSYLPPAKTVRRTRRYDGNLPVIYDAVHTEAEFGTTLSDTDFDYPTDTVIAVSGGFGYDREGDGTPAGDVNIGRVMLRFTIKCGQYYLKRLATFDDSVITTFFGYNGVQLQYTGHVYEEATWVTSVNYYEIVSVPFDEAIDYYGGFNFFIQSPPIATDETGLDITVEILGRDHNGNNEAALVTSADYGITNYRADIFAAGGNGDALIFTATNSATARYDIDQGECVIGDQDSANSIGVLRVLVGSDYVPTTAWQSLNFTDTGVGIHRLGVQEALAGQDKATPIQRGEVFGSEVHMWQVIDDNTTNFAGDYALFEMTYTARPVYTQIEAFRVDRDTTNVTTGFEDARPINDPIDGQPEAIGARMYQQLGQYVGIGARNYGSRDQRVNREIINIAGRTNGVADADLHIMNTWTGANGEAKIFLPPIAESYGRIIQFHSDSTISANTYVRLLPRETDTGTTIDGSASYDFNRPYDGITILGHTDDNWYIIQKKDK